MPPVGEMNATKVGQALQNAAVVGSSQSIPFSRESNRAMTVPGTQRNPPLVSTSELDQIKRTQYYPGRTVLFHQGERTGGVFIVRRGTVKLSLTSSKGRAVILRIAGPGEILALACVQRKSRTSTGSSSCNYCCTIPRSR
jgi:CRP-like cAMP-binding protein